MAIFQFTMFVCQRLSLGIALVESNLQRVIPLLKLPWVPLGAPARPFTLRTFMADVHGIGCARGVEAASPAAGDGTTYYVQFWPEISYING